jgi:hypothetical protein
LWRTLSFVVEIHIVQLRPNDSNGLTGQTPPLVAVSFSLTTEGRSIHALLEP